MLIHKFCIEARAFITAPVPVVHSPVLIWDIKHEMVVMIPIFYVPVVGNEVGKFEEISELHPKFTIVCPVSSSFWPKLLNPCVREWFFSFTGS